VFQLFYADGPADKDRIPEARGVQAIVQDHPEVGSELVTAADYYVRDADGAWRGVDIFGLFDYLLDSGVVLFGRTISRNDYQSIMREALKTKETWLPVERKF